METMWKRWAELSVRPTAITGAGISVPSGLPTAGKRWRNWTLKEMFTLEMYRSDPLTFYDCYRDMLLQWREAKPNPAHVALAEANVRIITQNLDGLHLKADSAEVLEIHGNLRELICEICFALYPSHVAEHNRMPKCPTCAKPLKPNIVLSGEDVRHIAEAADWVGQADLLLIVGTKLEMEPICSLPRIAKSNGVPIIHCNKKAEVLLPEVCRLLKT
ncbi:SIR2 family NAD-dependent protein deacylase [Tumebacillus algifaecis]|nr:Sir2 family NAD-dependent protein deacetylase [Tumebacillus algifaecis]